MTHIWTNGEVGLRTQSGESGRNELSQVLVLVNMTMCEVAQVLVSKGIKCLLSEETKTISRKPLAQVHMRVLVK
jgi:hypothetical protein